MTNELWHQWQADWRWMHDVAERRGWNLSRLEISAPASEAALRRLEAAAGLPVPEQLREVLSHYAASVRFDWYVPSHLSPMEQRNFPTSSFNRGFVWDIDQIENHAIPGFLAMKQGLAEVDESEAPNTPDMWERQFPVFWLINGDILTIDMRRDDSPHPVRYFSHELEMLHGQALAPDFLTFVSEMARLGQAGTEWASWMRFGEWDEDRYYLRADSPGGREWRRWLESDPALVKPDEPPPVILGETAAERALLEAAQRGDMAAATAALASGARPDVVWNPEWRRYGSSSSFDDEFATAVTFAVRRNDTSLVEQLLAHGASLDTRHLAVAEAVSRASVETLRWLCRKGARVDGWKNERYWPIHLLMTQRQRLVAASPEELEPRLREEYGLDGDETAALTREALEPLFRRDVEAFITPQDYLAMLETLLASGAAPDAPWDNGTTMLMWAGPESARILLRYGADPNYHAPDGTTPLHFTRSAAVARVLVEAGADVNALASPNGRKSETDPVYTPLQASLILGDLWGTELAKSLLELGADPSKRDGEGYPTLGYATSVPAFELMRPYGLDPHERMPDGGTLLHRLYQQRGAIRATFPEEVAILDLLLAEGLDINAQNNGGQTILHLAAPNAIDAASIELLLERGADRSLRDAKGKRAVDLIPRSKKNLRGALTSAL
ncbi:ankyrin repeat domain-containing protein [Consotaella aegiceratis]|uniref:ankyrin repeat domain-containing protein n=1 Tax=Consotaella aegiceratis TaxID=3097961 RepID=UPI002F3E6518